MEAINQDALFSRFACTGRDCIKQKLQCRDLLPPLRNPFVTDDVKRNTPTGRDRVRRWTDVGRAAVRGRIGGIVTVGARYGGNAISRERENENGVFLCYDFKRSISAYLCWKRRVGVLRCKGSKHAADG